MNVSSLLKYFVFFWRAKKIWSRPRKAKVLIFDRLGSEVFWTYINKENVHIMDIRGESLNLFVLMKCFMKGRLSLLDYYIQYLRSVKPDIVITITDNNHLFYKIKSHLKDLITVFVQNGIRGEAGDIFGLFKSQNLSSNTFHVDYMLTFGNIIGREYSKYINGNVIPIGSFRNNSFRFEIPEEPKIVLFLSQYRPPPNPINKPIYFNDDQPILWNQFYSAEKFLLPLLQKYCNRNNYKLKICGCSADSTNEERNYFRFLLNDSTVEILKKKNINSSYKNVHKSAFVVFVDTTLGYEALARGKKAAAFTIRDKSIGTASSHFGWPANLPDQGPFWTNHADESEFNRVMDYVTSVSDEEWEQTRQRYVTDLMEYDPGNSRFLGLMRNLGVPLNPEYGENAEFDHERVLR